jgi:dTDP-4-dehydrorhamnose 3,5-epimerase
MKFTSIKLIGSYIVDPEKRIDERGFFARMFCANEFKEQGITFRVVQGNVSYSKEKGTLRGMHYQVSPHQEDKLITVFRGAIYDVIIDIRPKSATYKEWFGIELTAENNRMLFVPKGFAHGFLTLTNDTEVMYLVSEYYTPSAERGIRYDDPLFNIQWPEKVHVVSEKDRSFPDFSKNI